MRKHVLKSLELIESKADNIHIEGRGITVERINPKKMFSHEKSSKHGDHNWVC